ncbi:hypothetical protein GCM10011409_19320 [Lentibacillus populi]|uniref:Antitoxin SocA-like Panacea domain-containing protein n=1 Tax=Lentibacillus populi TaxID=1827502 RepID=A0A9W5X5P9_9BACI|nr:type II toxin-antitoxin system antitoxin SocA domain-containing protein [Lentibacillus populi]GGB41909.1 hypothetical protein GCM10011409_19320 [Lentibacillus populi]
MVEYAQRDQNGYYQVQDVINWFLSKDSMSPKKLQKLLYYAYSWTLALQNEDVENLENKLFDNNFEAWVHGPVLPSVYHDFKTFGYHDIARLEDYKIKFDEDIEDILNQVWDEYGDYNGNQLESITHQEEPWKKARGDCSPIERCNTLISDEDIFSYYIQEVEYVD